MSHVLVLGAGNGGLALTADLVSRGVDVALYNRGEAALAAVRAQGGVRYEGVLGDGFAPVARVSTDLSSLVPDAKLIVACTPATAHASLAQSLAPFLRGGQRVVLNPGGMLGALAFLHELRTAGCHAAVRVAETGTLTHICRKVEDGLVRITSVLADLPFAALPGVDTPAFADEVRYALPRLRPMPHILANGFTNVNAVLHPPAMILGAAWIEASGGDFFYYHDTAVPSVARLMQALDAERLAVAAAWGVDAEPFLKLFARIGSTSQAAADQGDFRQALLDSAPNRWIKAPSSLDHRYMHEDMPFGAVPLADLGRAAGVPTPAFDAVITLASVATGRSYRAEGRTLASLSLERMQRADVLDLLVHTSIA